MVTTQGFLNFRDSPGGSILLTLPANVTLTAFEAQGDWILADWYGQRGWLHRGYVTASGACG